MGIAKLLEVSDLETRLRVLEAALAADGFHDWKARNGHTPAPPAAEA